jgi:hypothetical protein
MQASTLQAALESSYRQSGSSDDQRHQEGDISQSSRQDALGSIFSDLVYISGHRFWVWFSAKSSFSTAIPVYAN